MKTGNVTHIQMNEFRDACVETRPGETFIYATGGGLWDQIIRSKQDHGELECVRDLAWEASRQGRVFLTQRRLAAHLYEYRATKAGVVKKKAPARQAFAAA